jgi:hypothetical protein
MRHRQWNPKAFFRKVSPEVMSHFEAHHKLVLARDPKLPPSEQTYRAWRVLPESQREALETELLPVNDLCSTHARPYLEALATRVWVGAEADLVDASRDWTVNDLAMLLYLADPAGFAAAHQAYAVDMMEHFREYRGRYPLSILATEQAKAQMKTAMALHFQHNAGGAQCQVEDHQGADKFALFIYHEDQKVPLDRFDANGVVVPDWQRPVVRIAAVFYPDSLTLLIKAPRKPEREKLRDLFAELFIGDKDYFEDTHLIPKFSFAPLRDPSFDFPAHPADRIDSVCVVRVTARPDRDCVKRIHLELDSGLDLYEVHDALDASGVDPVSDVIDGVRLLFTFQGTGRSRQRTVSLHNPNSSNMRDTQRDRVIRRYLREWGFDASKSSVALAIPALPTPSLHAPAVSAA